jgi:hypothetical protein
LVSVGCRFIALSGAFLFLVRQVGWLATFR